MQSKYLIKFHSFDGIDGNIIIISKDNKHYRCHPQVLAKTCKYFKNISNTNELKIFKFDYSANIIEYVLKNIYFIVYQCTDQTKLAHPKRIVRSQKFNIQDNLLILEFMEILDISNDIEKFRQSIIKDIVAADNISKINLLKKINTICKNSKYRKTKKIFLDNLDNFDLIELNDQIIYDLDTDLKNKILLILSKKVTNTENVNQLIKFREYYEQTYDKIRELKNLAQDKTNFHKGGGHYEYIFTSQSSIEKIIDELYNIQQDLTY